MSSTPVVLRTGLNLNLQYVEINETVCAMNKTKESDAVAEVKHRHTKSVANLQYAPVTKSIIHVTTHEQKAPTNTLSRSIAAKIEQT